MRIKITKRQEIVDDKAEEPKWKIEMRSPLTDYLLNYVSNLSLQDMKDLRDELLKLKLD